MNPNAPDPIRDLRRPHTRGELVESAVDPNPIRQFRIWLDEALAAEIPEPNAMTVATTDEHGVPDARICLLRGCDERGFSFFTNYDSRKGRQLAQNPLATLVFWWPQHERQVRIEGQVERVTAQESDEYFASRPRGHKIGAWVSAQSTVIPNRDFLETRLAALEQQYPGEEVPRPPHWGGYRIVPTAIEFWQGRANRLHDRLRYTRTNSGWRMERLSP